MTNRSTQITLKLVFIQLLMVAISRVVNFKIAPTSHPASPEIWLAAYSEADAYRGVPPEDGFRFENQFKNDFISKNGSDYIAYEDVSSVVFACEADYPITWAFPYPEQMDDLEYYNYDFKEYRSSSFTEEQKTPTNVNYKIVLSLRASYHHGVTFLSLNVTCRSIENHIQSSIHFFQLGQLSIENEGETLEVYLEPSAPGFAPSRSDRYLGPPLVLPCRPATPDIKLLLEKRVVTRVHSAMEQIWKPLKDSPSQKYITFDPKIGFTVERGLFYGNKIYGMYRCSVLISRDGDDDGSTGDNVDSSQYVLVNVTSNRKSSDEGNGEMSPFETKSIIRGSASFQFRWDDEMTETVRCCSGVPDKPPKLYPFYCSSELHCQFIKQKIPEYVAEQEEEEEINKDKTSHVIKSRDRFNDSSDCARQYLYGEKMFLVCRGQNVDFAGEFINLFSSEALSSIGNRSVRVQEEEEKDGEYVLQGNSSDRRVTSLTHYAALSSDEIHNDGVNPSEKMFVTVGKVVRPKEVTLRTKSGLLGPSLPFRIHHPKAKKKAGSTVDSDDEFADLDIFEDLDELYASHYNYKSITRRSIQLLEYDRDVYYTGESLNFLCFGLNYFYATASKNEGGGAYLRLNWQNGTKQILNTNLKQGTSKLSKLRMLYRMVHLSGGADMVSGQTHQLNPLFATSLTAQKGMDSVDCWMAQRNSSSWDKISRKIRVEDSVAPKILEGKAEETVYFYLGEVGHMVSCVVVGAKPFPTYLKVTKDGKPLGLNFNKEKTGKDEYRNSTNPDSAESGSGSQETEKVDEAKDRITIKISFKAIRHDMQGVYQCTAKNVNGTAIRTINVFVLQKRGVALPVSLGIAGALCLVFGGLAIKHWRDKKTVLSLRTNQL